MILRRLGQFLNKERCRLVSINYRYASSVKKQKLEGIPFQIDEEQARLYFDQWLKSLWLAPSGWTESTREKAIDVNPYYLPFWHCSLHGQIRISIAVAYRVASSSGRKSPAVTQNTWFSLPELVDMIDLDDVNIYAAQTFDRYHLNQFDVSFQSNSIQSIENDSAAVDEWTVDQDTAFQIGWDLQIVPMLKNLALQKAKRMYPNFEDYRIKSFHWNIQRKQLTLYYYPMHIINYEYGSGSHFTCLVNGVDGSVTGDRQYSFFKVALATLVGFYPAAWVTLLTVGSLIDPSIGLALSSMLTFTNSIPLALILSPIIGFFAQNYPKYYRNKISRQEWRNYQSNSQEFTYDFRSSYQEQYQSYERQQRRTEYREQTSKKAEMEDLYELLSISRTATDREIKRAYLLKAKELHPDRNPGDKKAEELFKKVNQAFSILSDPYKRQQYDQFGYDAVKYK